MDRWKQNEHANVVESICFVFFETKPKTFGNVSVRSGLGRTSVNAERFPKVTL